MVIIEYNGKAPDISSNAYVSPLATLIGDIRINDNVVIFMGIEYMLSRRFKF